MPQVEATKQTAVVLVEEVHRAADAIRNVNGMQITLILRQRAAEGRSYIFFTNVVLYGSSLAARESGRLSVGRNSDYAQRLVNAAFDSKEDRALQQRIARATLVVAGKVLRTEPLPRDPRWPESEHDPQWWTAVLHVDSFAKGQGPTELTIIFPSSKDELWIDAPKFKPDQEGVWILQRDTKEKVPPVYAVRGLTALDPRDFQPRETWDKVRRLAGRQR
ncbi:MAG TPA: hypothetical protein VJ875_18855 [Pyrinomonadaceae bacterium]|nr:hypothetical protein [Pyrinomonadaceae bacterium]